MLREMEDPFCNFAKDYYTKGRQKDIEGAENWG